MTQEYIDKYQKTNDIIDSIVDNLEKLKSFWENYEEEQKNEMQ